MKQEGTATEKTLKWLNEIVINLNFCPLAKREVQRNTIRYVTVDGENQDPITTLLDELQFLDHNQTTETTLIIISAGMQHFNDFLDVVDKCECLIDQGGYRGHYQLATFHPKYVFSEENNDSPSNYTNRSPLPILHLLRETSLTRVLNTYSEPENIPLNNIATTQKLGICELQKRLDSCQKR
jgi:hypothetical protein